MLSCSLSLVPGRGSSVPFCSKNKFTFPLGSSVVSSVHSVPYATNSVQDRRLTAMASSVSAGTSVELAEPVRVQEEAATLIEFLSRREGVLDDGLAVVLMNLQAACKRIAALLASPTAVQVTSSLKDSIGATTAARDVPKPLDIVSNDIIKSALKRSGNVAALASEEEDSAVWFGDGQYVVVFDPLDGSRNIDASIPTGTIFGIYKSLPEVEGWPEEEKASRNVLQPGSKLLASGYALYSSATMLCLTVGSGSHGFTLDGSFGEFVLTHPNLHIPKRGQIYSVNDARYHDWPAGLRRYIDDIRQGKGQYPKKYSARYICSLVADLHRTILYGGIAMNPRSHLRLIYEANPLSFLVEQAQGKGSDGKRRILDIQPAKLHERLPLFLGSPDDILELESYGDVQQLVNPGYEV